MKAIDRAPRITRAELARLLHAQCGIRLLIGPPPISIVSRERDFYVIRFSGGMVKVGGSNSIKNRLTSLPCEARKRFPGVDMEQTMTVIVVVPVGGYPLEAAVHRALACDRLQGDWYRGALADCVADALAGAKEAA
jgi:hypothetical protein